jgi:hypothetical protein
MDWRCGSSSRLPALQEGSPEFKPQSQEKKIVITKTKRADSIAQVVKCLPS